MTVERVATDRDHAHPIMLPPRCIGYIRGV
jgi:hypothetical protein